MGDLRIAQGLKLDPDYVGGGTFALLAKKGAGKTYAMRVLAEEFWKAQIPVVALDPLDAFWGLRSSADGEGEGIPVAVFGGPHGDAPLEKTGGRLMADLVV
jgi:DNA helicase HerA-like ATPase